MGWSDCGTDDRGRRIGYAFKARCDHSDCWTRIDRGLSYVCGGMHGGGEEGCGEYFCGKHRTPWKVGVSLCDACLEYAERRNKRKK